MTEQKLQKPKREKAPALSDAGASSWDCAIGGAAIPAGNRRHPSRKVKGVSEFFLYVTHIGQEWVYSEKPDNRPTLHVWVDDSNRQWTVTYHRHLPRDPWPDGSYHIVHPVGLGWQQWENEPPAFMELRTHRPSAVWWRKAP